MMDFTLSYCMVSLAIIVTVYVLLRKQRRDDYRSDLRRIRDRLFDFVWQNGFDFNEPAYQEARQMLNGLIRYSDHMTPVSFLRSAVTMRKHKQLFARPPVPVPSDQRFAAEIARVREEAATVTIRFVFLTGLFGWFVRLLLFIFQMNTWVKGIRSRSKQTAHNLVSGASAWGRDRMTCNQFRQLAGSH